VQARVEDDAQCLLVIMGATAEGKKELVGLADGIITVRRMASGELLEAPKGILHPWRLRIALPASSQLKSDGASRRPRWRREDAACRPISAC
jgi:hypothetical protein